MEVHGTTLLCMVIKDGEEEHAIVASDSLMRLGTMRFPTPSEKIFDLDSSNSVVAGAGNADFIKSTAAALENQIEENREFLNKSDPILVARTLEMMLCIPKYKGVDDTIFIIAGWQPEEGPHVYVIDSKGSRLFEQFKNFGPTGFKHLLGSGAMRQVNHYLDQGYRYEMSLQEALDLAESVICFASTLDRGTGGLVHVRYLSRNTLRRQSPRDIANLVENKYKEVFQQFLNGGYSSMEE